MRLASISARINYFLAVPHGTRNLLVPRIHPFLELDITLPLHLI